MSDISFLKYYVCAYNGWNPFSEEIKRIPDFYWIISFYSTHYDVYREWETIAEPQAELISMITNPANFAEYTKMKKAKERNDPEIKVGNTISTEATAHYDPTVGLVDGKGNTLMSREDYEKLSGMNGIMVGF